MDPERRADTDVGAAEPWAAVQQALWAWRRAHPTATFNEIEDAVDQQFAALRAQVLADLSLASRAADVQAKQAGAPPRCPACGRGSSAKARTTGRSWCRGARRSTWSGTTRSAPPAGRGFSPLDEELGLLPGAWSPHLQEHLARVGARLPFAQAAAEFTAFTGVAVSETTMRRHTEHVGAAYVAVQTAAVEQIEQAAQRPAWDPASATATDPRRPTPELLQVSVDGAMVPVLGGEWAEVKTLAVGEVVPRSGRDGVPAPHAENLSYFSRLTDAATFTRLATVEVHRRGVDRARVVVAPQDGAEWEQTFLGIHRPDAIRILDFPHAAEHLTRAARARWGVGTPETAAWLDAQCHELKHGSAHAVLGALARLPVAEAPDPHAAAEQRAASLQYLTKRLDQLQYATFQQLGYPIGSGCLESANKLVVEARLKGSGMHWARAHVNPPVALRTALCSNRWAEAWNQITAHQRRQRHQRRRDRQQARHPAPPPVTTPLGRAHPPRALRTPPPVRSPRVVNGRPTADHPWRRPLLADGRRFAATAPKS